MNTLLKVMSKDMKIARYARETDTSFIYRLCYSALGQWCLHTALNSSLGAEGTTKHNQTIVMNELLKRYMEIFPNIGHMFGNADNQSTTLPVHIRNVYEQTGYLLTDDNNRNTIANYGRSIEIGDKALFFGIPTNQYSVNGLGVFTYLSSYNVSVKEFIIRDDLSVKKYFDIQFDIIDFYEKDINSTEFQFFNPLSKYSPSQSWTSEMKTDYTVARKTILGPYYRVMKSSDGNLLYADEFVESQDDINKSSLTLYEYRRLYFALREHYKNPIKATITQIDDTYAHIQLQGHLPNREYYLLLLLAWPANNAFDKINFITNNNSIQIIIETLANIGIIIEGDFENE